MTIDVKQYKDFDGNIVKIGDYIAEVDIVSGETKKNMGEVLFIKKQGFYIHPETSLTHRKNQLWGKFTRKIN